MNQEPKLSVSSPSFKEWGLIVSLALTKLLVHFFTYSNFELHRDAYLYYAQSEHLAWGFIAVPPSIAFVGKIATSLFGNTAFALRFFPALIGAANIIIIGLAVRQLGGKTLAVALAGFAYLLSPAYLHTNALFQPVSFNHFYWLLSSFLILLLIGKNDPRMWLWIAITFGFGFLNKYSIVFFYAAFSLSLLLSPYRHLYLSRYFLLAIIIGLVIISPNLIWQYMHHWPVMFHMAELRETQLVHVRLSDFLISQLLMNAQALLLWVGALFMLLFHIKERQYRLFGFTYLFILAILIFGSGKAYYTLGIYPILFAFGGYFVEKYVHRYQYPVSAFLIVSMFSVLYYSLSMDGIPLSTFEKSIRKGAFRWEDGVNHDIPQDMADMTGWKEIGEKVTDVYLALSPRQRTSCDIFCQHYGQAGAVMFYGKKVEIPQPISFNGSFVFWDPDSLAKEYVIWVHSNVGNTTKPDSLLPVLFGKFELKATVDDKYFRENGTQIYLCQSPTDACKNLYKSRIQELKKRYQR